jgi:hypothetical protein
MNSMTKFAVVLAVIAIVPFVFLSSCKKEVDCPGLPEQMEGYFPSVSELKFSNGLGDTLTLPVSQYSRDVPRTLSNNPLSAGGTGSKPFCYETLKASSTMSIPIYWSFELGVSEEEKATSIRLSITEEFVSSNYFETQVGETPSSLGDYKVFGDTLVIGASQVSSLRFSEAQIVYGQGLVKLHDVANNCDWTRVW